MTRETFIEMRKSLEMSQTAFAKLINKSRSYVSKLEQGLIPITKSAECEILVRVNALKNETCVNFNTSNDEKVIPEMPLALSSELEEYLEVVQANNELLEKIRKDQERELELKRAQGRQINEALELLQGMDTVVQSRVRDIIDERTRTIIAMSRHHISMQAQVILTAIEGIINMIEEGVTKKSLILRQLNSVREQIKEIANNK